MKIAIEPRRINANRNRKNLDKVIENLINIPEELNEEDGSNVRNHHKMRVDDIDLNEPHESYMRTYSNREWINNDIYEPIVGLSDDRLIKAIASTNASSRFPDGGSVSLTGYFTDDIAVLYSEEIEPTQDQDLDITSRGLYKWAREQYPELHPIQDEDFARKYMSIEEALEPST
ncbi:MAG: hypothetical protein U5J64_08000 [Halobacteriales archaeon]|nr:hypothetical protein [Halobacteriales archaeon]